MKTFYQYIFCFVLALNLGAEVLASEPSSEVDNNQQESKPAAQADNKPEKQNKKSSKKGKKASKKTLPPSAFSRVLWTDLIPEDDLAALMNPPDYLADIIDGSAEDQMGASVGAADDRYQQALASTRVVDAMDGEAVKIPGFVVPIEFDDEQTITQFFLVPYFGACIHEPPPPPNQIIFVDFPKGLKLSALYDPFWISGILETSVIDNGLATAAYIMEMHHYEAYLE